MRDFFSGFQVSCTIIAEAEVVEDSYLWAYSVNAFIYEIKNKCFTGRNFENLKIFSKNKFLTIPNHTAIPDAGDGPSTDPLPPPQPPLPSPSPVSSLKSATDSEMADGDEEEDEEEDEGEGEHLMGMEEINFQSFFPPYWMVHANRGKRLFF